MSFRVNTNVASLAAQRNLGVTTRNLSKNFQRLSSGLRINRSSDDAAGLAISERLRAQIRSLHQASRNSADGVSVLETAEGALNQIGGILSRMKELATEAANGTNAAGDRDALDAEFDALQAEITRIASATDFNGNALLDGTVPVISIQIGDGTTAGVDTIDLALDTATSAALGVDAIDIGSVGDPIAAITALNTAINTITTQRASLGALQNRLSHAQDNLSVEIENLSAAESRIRDVDFASEMANFTKNQILQQAGTAMLAQANAMPQTALALLG